MRFIGLDEASPQIVVPRGKMLSSREAAERLGVKTATLANWRLEGKDPKGAVHMADTVVAYPEAEIDRYLADRIAHPRKRGRPAKRPVA